MASLGSLIPRDVSRSRAFAAEEAAIIVDKASHWTKRSDCLPDHLRARVELEPNQKARTKYFQEFLTLEELHEFDLECRSHLASVKAQRQARRRRHQAFDVAHIAALFDGDAEAQDNVQRISLDSLVAEVAPRGRGAEAGDDVQFGSGEESLTGADESCRHEVVPSIEGDESQVAASNILNDVQLDPDSTEGSVSSCAIPRRQTGLASQLGKYWDLPAQRSRRTRKQTIWFSPW